MNNSFLAPQAVERIIINGYDLTDYDQNECEYEVVTDTPQDGDSFMAEVLYFPAVVNKEGEIIYLHNEDKRYSEYNCMKIMAEKIDPRHESYDKDAGEFWKPIPHIRVAKHTYERI